MQISNTATLFLHVTLVNDVGITLINNVLQQYSANAY